MKLSIMLILTVIISVHAMAQHNELIHLWEEDVPGATEAKQGPEFEQGATDDVKRITKVTNPVVEVFRPKEAVKNGVGVVICPGGGYQILAIDLEGYEIAEWLADLGYTAFVLQYRVPQKPKEALYDAQRAMRMVRFRSEDFGLDKDRIGLMGFSAGASLTARLSTQYQKDLYVKEDEVDTVSSRPNFSILIYPAYLDQGDNRSLTPELMLDKRTAPMFVFATADDPYANSALVMATALRDHEVPVELHLLPEGGHGYGLREGNQAADTWPMLLEKWLKNQTHKKK